MAEAIEASGQQVLTRIGFAERWLDRAKRQCQEGDVSRGLLTLVLASAEMTHALRTVRPGAAPSRRRWLAPAVAVAAVASVVVVVLAGWQPWAPAPVSDAASPIIVTLNDHVGSFLQLVEVAPAPAVTTPVIHKAQTRPLRYSTFTSRPIGAAEPAPAARLVPSAPAPVAAVLQPVPAGAVAAAPPVPVPAAVVDHGLSDTELIDLVLTAERTLRTPRP